MKALVFENDPSCPLARLEGPMATRGISADTATPADIRSLGDPADYDVAIILGSDESAYDDTVPWVADQLQYAQRAIRTGVPILGICFGAQMLARALGGVVRRAPEPEVAWKSMTRAEAADWLPAGPWLTWHADTFDWPPGATPLAWTEMAPQAFAHGDHLGLQFHPEVTAELIEQWLEVERRKLALRDLNHQALLQESRQRDLQAGEDATLLFERYFDRLLSR